MRRNEYISVLVYVPAIPYPPRVHERTWASLMAMDCPARVEIVVGREDLNAMPSRIDHNINLTGKYQRARQMALSGGYDALLTVEADMVVPPLALERLSRIEADVAYGLYCSRHGSHQWLAYVEMDERKGSSLTDAPEVARAAWGQAIATDGVGLGCTLIWRRVLEAVPFRLDHPDLHANDWEFALDCKAKGFVQKHDLGTACGHISMDVEGAPVVYWPDPDGKGMYRVESL